MQAKTLKEKGIKVILAATVVSAGTYTFVPHSFADSTTEINEVQNTSANVLKDMEVDGVQFDQAFSSDLLDYHATIENNVTNIVLHMTRSNENEVITLNGNTVADPSKVPLDVKTGENIFLIQVDDGVNAPVTYTLTIMKKSSANNVLQNIKLSSGKLSKAFNSSVGEYDVQVSNDVNSLTVTPEVFEGTESVKINGILMNKEGVPIKLPVGKLDINITVTAENGDSRNYVLHVMRAEKSDQEIPVKKPTTRPSNNQGEGWTNKTTFPVIQTGQKNPSLTQKVQGSSSQGTGNQIKQSQAQLSTLSVSSGTWNKTFSRDEYTYHIAVGSSVKSVTLKAIPRTNGATVSIEGGKSSVELGDYAKKTIISIVVTKDDERKTYVLVFDKDVKQKKSSESVVTATSSNDHSVNTVQTNNTSVQNQIQYANRNQTKQSTTSWWTRLWDGIRGLF